MILEVLSSSLCKKLFLLFMQDQNESAAILKIKETMQEEAKRFEKDTPGEHPDYFMHQP